MTIIQRRNAEAELLSSVDQRYAERNHLFKAHGTLDTAYTSAVVAAYPTTVLNTAPELFSFDGSNLTITEAGFYMVSFKTVLMSAGSAGAGESAVYLEEDPDTGSWATVPGSLVYAGILQNLRQTAQSKTLLMAGTDYRYRVSMIRTSGADPITTTGTRVFDCVRLFKTE